MHFFSIPSEDLERKLHQRIKRESVEWRCGVAAALNGVFRWCVYFWSVARICWGKWRRKNTRACTFIYFSSSSSSRMNLFFSRISLAVKTSVLLLPLAFWRQLRGSPLSFLSVILFPFVSQSWRFFFFFSPHRLFWLIPFFLPFFFEGVQSRDPDGTETQEINVTPNAFSFPYTSSRLFYAREVKKNHSLGIFVVSSTCCTTGILIMVHIYCFSLIPRSRDVWNSPASFPMNLDPLQLNPFSGNGSTQKKNWSVVNIRGNVNLRIFSYSPSTSKCWIYFFSKIRDIHRRMIKTLSIYEEWAIIRRQKYFSMLISYTFNWHGKE